MSSLKPTPVSSFVVLSDSNLVMSSCMVRVRSSGSGSSEEDDKKRKRKLSNRESAKRSRQRKQKHEEDMINEIASLKSAITEEKQKIANTEKAHSVVEAENRLLSSEKAKLEEQLGGLNLIIDNYSRQPVWVDHLGPELSEPQMLLNPWQLQESFNHQPPVFAASGSVFPFNGFS